MDESRGSHRDSWAQAAQATAIHRSHNQLELEHYKEEAPQHTCAGSIEKSQAVSYTSVVLGS